jgi:hypothetical protein
MDSLLHCPNTLYCKDETALWCGPVVNATADESIRYYKQRVKTMGARINYNIKQPDGLYTVLYSHWGADKCVAHIAKALKAASGRWTDTNYCTRIIISQIVGDEWEDTTGYGVQAATEPNYDDAWLIIDLEKQTVEGLGGRYPFVDVVPFADMQLHV